MLLTIWGIKLFGKGNWAIILSKNKVGFHPSRTSVSLKDRNIVLGKSHSISYLNLIINNIYHLEKLRDYEIFKKRTLVEKDNIDNDEYQTY